MRRPITDLKSLSSLRYSALWGIFLFLFLFLDTYTTYVALSTRSDVTEMNLMYNDGMHVMEFIGILVISKIIGICVIWSLISILGEHHYKELVLSFLIGILFMVCVGNMLIITS